VTLGRTATGSLTVSYIPTGILTGTLTDLDSGLPVDSGTVSLTDAGNQVQTARSDALGRYSLSGLIPGSYSGKISADGYFPSSFSVTIGQGEAVVRDAALVFFTVRSLGDSGNVALMEVAGNYDANKRDGSNNAEPRQAVATEYFKTHGEVDYLVFLSSFDYLMPDAEVTGFYSGVRNDTLGINQALFDYSKLYGSAGSLQGTIDLGNMSALAAAPYGSKLDDTVSVLNHELMHRFGAYVRFKNPDGSLNGALIGKDAAHWSYLLDTKVRSCTATGGRITATAASPRPRRGRFTVLSTST
jgi:hypothetical protein